MASELVPTVVIACHLVKPDELCATTVARLRAALHYASTSGDNHVFIVTGDARYEPESPTLCELMRNYLLAQGTLPAHIHMATGGTGSFLEPEIVMEAVRSRYPEARRLVVVSSNWHLWVAHPFWKRFEFVAKPEKLEEVCFLVVHQTGGWRTQLFYAAYAFLIRAVLFADELLFANDRLWPRLERVLNERVYARRSRSFRFNGCA